MVNHKKITQAIVSENTAVDPNQIFETIALFSDDGTPFEVSGLKLWFLSGLPEDAPMQYQDYSTNTMYAKTDGDDINIYSVDSNSTLVFEHSLSELVSGQNIIILNNMFETWDDYINREGDPESMIMFTDGSGQIAYMTTTNMLYVK